MNDPHCQSQHHPDAANTVLTPLLSMEVNLYRRHGRNASSELGGGGGGVSESKQDGLLSSSFLESPGY